MVSTGEQVYVVSSSLSTVNAYSAKLLGPLASFLTCNIVNGDLNCVDGDGVSVWQTDASGQLQLGSILNVGYSAVNLKVQITT